MKKPKRTNNPKKLSAKNSKILHDTMVTLGALKEANRLHDLPIHEIQVHLLDDAGDGIILCLEYDEPSGELNKTFHNTEEYYTDEDEDENADTAEPLSATAIDACASPENIKEFLKKRIEETISEEYDEIFHSSDNDDDDEPPPLLN